MTDRKKILFLSPFFHPEMISTGRYNTHLVRGLVEQGCDVQVVASHPLYPDWKPTPSSEGLPGVTIHRGGLGVRYPRSNLLRRAILECWYMVHAGRWAWRLRKEVDLVVAIFPPELFMFPLRRILSPGIPIVGVVHDIQGIMARSADSRLRRFAGALIGRLERRAFRSCDRLICLSRSMAQALIERYGADPGRVEIHYPFVTTVLEGGESTDALAAHFPADRLHVVYAGALGEKQRPHELLNFFQALCRKRSDVMCHIFSSGPFFEALRHAQAGHSSGECIRFHGLVPDKQLPELYARSTVQVIPQAVGTGAGAFPSKLPNLLHAGVPVFAICDPHSELARVIEETGIGAHVSGADTEAWAKALAGLLDRLAGMSRGETRNAMADYVARHFGVEQVGAAILETVPGLTSEGGV